MIEKLMEREDRKEIEECGTAVHHVKGKKGSENRRKEDPSGSKTPEEEINRKAP